MSKFLEEFGKRNFQNTDPNRKQPDAQIPLTGPITDPNTSSNPNLLQRSFQGLGTNMWHEFLNSWDEISKGEPQQKLVYIQQQLDTLDSDPGIREEDKVRMKSSLEAHRNAALQEIQDIQGGIDERPVDKDYTQKKDHFMSEEGNNWIDEMLYALPNEFGGTASGFKYQIASMLGYAASSAAEGAIGGPVGAAAGFIGGVGGGIYFTLKGRQQETASEVAEAYGQKINMLTQNFTEINKRQPNDEEARQIRMQAYKGLDELEAKNNSLAAGDVVQTALSIVPWLKWESGIQSILGSRMLKGAMATGFDLGINSIGEGMEEGEQFLYKKDYMSNNFMDNHGIFDYAKRVMSDRSDVVPAIFGQGRYDLYGDKDFRQAVKSGFTTGLIFDGANTTFAKLNDFYQYNKVKSSLSKEAASSAEESFTKYKANTIYDMFSRGREEKMYKAIETFGNKGIFGYTKDSAKQEVEKLKTLKENFDNLNDAIKSPTGLLYKAYLDKTKGKESRLAVESLKQEAFHNYIALENMNSKLQDLYAKNDTEDNTDHYGYIGSDKQTISDEVNKQVENLGLDPDITKRVKNNRIDSAISGLENRINKMKERTKSILTGEAITKEKERLGLLIQLASEKDEKKKYKLAALYNFKYEVGENAAIESFKQRDSMHESLTTADNIKIVKDLDSKRDIGDLLEEVTSASIPLDSRVYDRIKEQAQPLAEHIAELEAKIEKGPEGAETGVVTKEAEDAYNQMYDEYAKLPDLGHLLDKAQSQVQELSKKVKTDDEYRREYHDSHFKDIDALEDTLKSPDNEPLDQAADLQASLEVLKDVYSERKELHKLDEFKGFREALESNLERINNIVAEIERRAKDREAKNIRIVNEKATATYALFNSSNFPLFTPAELEQLNKEVKEHFEKTGIVSSVFGERLITKLRQNKNTSLVPIDNVISGYINYITSIIPSKGAASNYAINPEKGFKDAFRSLTRSLGSNTYFEAIQEYLRTRSIYAMGQVLANDTSLVVPEVVKDLMGTHSALVAALDLKEAVESNFEYSTQVADEKEITEAKNFDSAPSLQQRGAMHAILRWLASPMDQTKMFQGMSYLSGFAGTGKTFLAGMVRKFLNVKDNEIFVVAHSKSANDTLAKSLEIDTNKPKYKTEQSSPLDHLIDLLRSQSPLLKETKLIVMDEAGFVSAERMSLLARLLLDYNNTLAKEDRIKVLAFGDAYQISEDGFNIILDSNLGDQINIKVFKPLSITYRTGVTDIINVANRYFSFGGTVDSLKTRTNPSHTEGVVTSNVESDLVRDLQRKLKDGTLDDSRTRLVIVQDQAAVERISSIITHPTIKVLTYIDAQGLTADEAYISLGQTDALEQSEFYNKAMYTSITRARHFVYLVDKNLSEVSKPKITDSFNDVNQDNANQITDQKEKYVKTVNDEYDYLKANGIQSESSLSANEVEQEIEVPGSEDTETKTETTNNPEIPETADTEVVAPEDINTPPIIPAVVSNVPASPSDHSLMFPQSFTPDRTTGQFPITSGDEVVYVKAIDSKTKKIHIKVLKPSGNAFRLVGILGTENANELDSIAKNNPNLAKAINAALNDGTKASSFETDPSIKDLLTLGLNEDLNVIARGNIKEHSPAKVLWSNDLKDITPALRTKVEEDVRKALLKDNQRASKIEVTGVIYTLKGATTGIGVPIEEIPESQGWVKPGIPYLRVKVSLPTGGTNIFHVNLKFSKLDPERHASFLSPLTTFLDSVDELTSLYEKAGLDSIYGYNDPTQSSLHKVDGAGNPIKLSKAELFKKSIQWYPGSGGLDETGEAEGIGYLANPKNVAEKTAEEVIKTKLTPEELSRVYDLRSTIHNLIGISKFKSLLDLSKNTDMDRIPQEVDEAPVNKSTNLNKVGTADKFTIFEGTTGLVGVRYFEYLGYFFKIKVPAVKIGNEYKLRGAVKCRIQRTLEASSDNEFSVRDNLSIGTYEESLFDSADSIKGSLDALASQAKRYDGKDKNSGAAQSVMHVLAKVNTQVTVPGGGVIPIRKSVTFLDDEGNEKTQNVGINLMPSTLDETTPNLSMLGYIHNNVSGELNFPIKALDEDHKTEEGDYFDTSLVQTDYEGFEPTKTVIGNITTEKSVGELKPTVGGEVINAISPQAQEAIDRLKRLGSNRRGSKLSKYSEVFLGSKISNNEAIDLIKKYIPNIGAGEIRFVSEIQMLKLTGGEAAWGYFQNGIIYLETGDGTTWSNAVRHEIFHKIYWNSFDATDRLKYYKLALKYNPSLIGKSNAEVEEWLAESFQTWKNTGKTEYIGLKGLFQRIADFIKFLFSNRSKLDRLFRDIENGKFVSRYGSANISRPLTKINEKFGSLAVYQESKALLLDYLARYTNDYKEIDSNGDRTNRIALVSKVDDNTYDYIPLTLDEAVDRFKRDAAEVVSAFDAGADLGDLADEVPYMRALLNGKNINEVTKDFYRFNQDTSYEEDTQDMEQFFEGSIYEEAANLKQEIEAAEFVNLESKVTNNIKDVLNSIYYKNSKGERKHLKWSFCYLKMLQIMQYVDLHNSKDIEKQIKAAFKFQDTTNSAIKSLFTEVSDLFTLSGISSYRTENEDGTIVSKELPENIKFDSEDVLYFNGKPITKRKSENTVQYFLRLSKETGADLNALNVAFRKQKAINTINEFISHFGSQRERNPFGGVVKTYKEEIGGQESVETNYLYNVPNNADIESAIDADIASFLVSQIERNRSSVAAFSNKFNAKAKEARTNTDKVELLKSFFKFLGKNIKTDNMITDPAAVSDALRDAYEFMAGALASSNLEDFIENSTGRTKSLASLIAFHNPEARAANYVDPKNRRRYKWVSQSGSYSLLSRISKASKFEFKGIQLLPEFLRNTEGVTQRYLDNNIFINGRNKIEEIVDPEYMVYSESNKVVEYRGETKEDALARRFNIQFLGYLLKNKKNKVTKYIQQVYTISNKPVGMGLVVNHMKEKELKASIKDALMFELNRKDYINNLRDKGITVKNLDKAANHIYFDKIGAITEAKRADMLANIDSHVEASYTSLVEKAKKAYAVYSEKIGEADSRLNSQQGAEIANKLGIDTGSDNNTEKLYISYYLNNYINGYFLSHLYFGDRAFAKLNKWDDVIKRLQSTFGIGKTPAIGPNGAMETFKVVVAKDDQLFINKNTDYTGTLDKLHRADGYDSTDAQMYVLPSFVDSIRRGLGNSTATKDILKPVYFGIDKFGIPRLIKTSALELTDELVADFPELRAIRDNLISTGSHALVFESAMKIGTPTNLSKLGEAVNPGSIVELNTADLRIQLNPLAKLDSEVASFSQLLYLLNVNRLNDEITDQVYKANADLITRNLTKLLGRISSETEGEKYSESKLRNIVLNSFKDSEGRVMSGSERLFELLSLGISGNDRVPYEGDAVADKAMTKLSMSMPSLVKKVITQISSSFTGAVALKFRGTKAVLTSAAPIKMYETANGESSTYSGLSTQERDQADKFYTDYTKDEQKWLIKAREAKEFGAVDKFKADLKASEGLSASFTDRLNAYISSDNTKFIAGSIIPKRLRMMSSIDNDPFKNYAEAVVPYDMAKSIADKLGIDMNELKNTMIGVRIPSTGIHSSIPIKIVGYLNTRSNIICVPEEIVPLHGSDFDVDSLFVIKREELAENETNDTVRIKDTYLTKKEQVFFNGLFKEAEARLKDKFGDKYDESRAKKEFAKAVGVWYSDETGNFEKYTNEKSSKLGLDTLKVLNSAFRALTDEEKARFEEAFQQESARVKDKVATADKPYVEDIHRASFATKNRLVYSDETKQFTSGAVRIATQGDFIGYSNSSLDPKYLEYLDFEIQQAKEYTSDNVYEVKRAKNLINTLERLKDKYLKNTVMDGYLRIVTDEKNRKDMNTPISMSVLNDTIFNMLRKLTGKKELLGNLDPNDEIDQVDIQMINMSGASEVGKIANTMKGLAYLSNVAHLANKEALINYKEDELPFAIDGVNITKLEDNQLPMGSTTIRNSWETLDSLINAAIDNVKEQILGIINLNSVTGNTFSTLIGVGVPIEHVVMLMHQPIIKEVSFLNTKVNNALEAIIEDLSTKGGLTEEEKQDTFYRNILTQSQLENGVRKGTLDAVADTKEGILSQIAAAKLFMYFNKLGNSVFEATSGVNLTRSMPIEIEGIRESVANLNKTASEDFAFKNVNLNNTPHIKEAKHVAEVLDDVIQNTIVGQDPKVTENVKSFISQTGIRLEYMNAAKNVEMVKEELIKYLLSSYSGFEESPKESFQTETAVLQGNEAWVQNFLVRVYDIKNNPEYVDNAFLQYVSTEPITRNSKLKKLTFNAGTALSDDEKLNVSNDFLKLSPEEQKDFLKYSVLIQGMRFGVSSYSTYMNPILQAGLSEYLEGTISKLLADKESFDKYSEHFGIQLSLKNIDKIPNIPFNQLTSNVNEDEESYHYSMITSTSSPKFVRIGKKGTYTLMVKVKEEQTVQEGKESIFKAYYTKVTTPKDTKYSDFINQIYSVNSDVINNGWSVESRFDMDTKVLTAPSSQDASTITSLDYSTTDKTQKVGKKLLYPVKSYDLQVGSLVGFVNGKDILRNSMYFYTVKSIETVESDGYLVKRITYSPLETRVNNNDNSQSTYTKNAYENKLAKTANAVRFMNSNAVSSVTDVVTLLDNFAVTPQAKLVISKMKEISKFTSKMKVKVVTSDEFYEAYVKEGGDISREEVDSIGGSVFRRGGALTMYLNKDTLLSGKADEILSSLEHTITHEFGHILLRHTLTQDNDGTRFIKGEAKGLFNKINDAFEKFKDSASDKELRNYGFSNVDEFLAEFLSNPYFRGVLSGIIDKQQESFVNNTLYDKVKAIIRKVLDWLFSKEYKAKPETADTLNLIEQSITKLIDITQPTANNVTFREYSMYHETGRFDFFKDVDKDTEFNKKLKDFTDNLEVTEDEKNYVNRTTGKLYTRSGDLRNQFNPYPSKDYSRADEDFKYKNKETDTIKVYYNNKETQMTYEEYKTHLEKLGNTEKIRGRVVHKIIQMLATGDMALAGQIAEMSEESDKNYSINYKAIQNWLLETWKDRLKELGISVGKVSGAVLGKDIISSEVAVAMEDLGIAGTIDMLVQHDDGSYTIVDFKSGKSLLRRSRFPRLMNFSKNNSQIEWNAMSQAKLQLMLYAVMLKANNRDIKFRDIFVSHIDLNTVTDNANPVEFKSYLAVLEEYFRTQKPEWYALNKDLFNSSLYGGSIAEVDSDMEFNKANPVEQQRIYETKLRKINLQLENKSLKNVEKAELQDKAKDLVQKILQLESIGVRLDDHNKDMSMPRTWVDNMYSVADPMAQAFAKFTFDRKNKMRQHLHSLKEEHNALLQPIIDDYKGLGRKIISKVGLNFNSYQDLYGFLYVNTPDGRKFATEKGNMTDAQWEYSKYLRTTMKYEFYLTMSPKKLISEATADSKSKTGIEKTLADRYLEIAKTAPKIDKFQEFSAFKNRDFSWEDAFVPYVPAKNEESFKLADMFKGSTYVKLLKRYVIDKLTVEAVKKSYEQYGLPIKFMTSAGFNDEAFTMNSAAIFENFITSTVGKRYMDSVYSVGRTTADYFNYTQNAEKTGYLTNTAKFIQHQTILHTTNERIDTEWFSKGIIIGNRKLSLDSLWYGLKSYTSALILVGKWKAGVINGIMEIIQNRKEAVVGSISKRLIDDPRFVNFTTSELTLANGDWIRLQADLAAGKGPDNKLYNLLRIFNYQTDNRMYPTDKKEILGSKNPILQQSTMYAHFSLPEQYTNAMVLIAQMRHDKNTDGKSMWDSYDNKGHYIGKVRGVSTKGEKIGGYTSEEITKLKSISAKIHGGYREDERAAIELYALGSAFMQFKRFMPNWIWEAWGSKREVSNIGHLIETGKSTTTDENGNEVEVPILSWENSIQEGSARTTLKWLVQSVGHATKLNRLFVTDSSKGPVTNYRWSQLTPAQQMNVISINVRIATVASVMMAIEFMFGDTPDDDEWKRRFGRMNFDLANGLNPQDLIRVGTNPTVVMPTMYKMSEGLYEFIFESGIKGELVKTGEHKGEYKGKSKIKKYLPGVAQYENFTGPDK